MRALLLLAALAAAACKPSEPPVQAPAAEPEPGTPMPPAEAEKYLERLRAEVKRLEAEKRAKEAKPAK